jgi:hypothetical protein
METERGAKPQASNLKLQGNRKPQLGQARKTETEAGNCRKERKDRKEANHGLRAGVADTDGHGFWLLRSRVGFVVGAFEALGG